MNMWELVKRISSFMNNDIFCKLCVEEKLVIISQPDPDKPFIAGLGVFTK